MKNPDCVVVGASFAGLSCAMALARKGLRVTVLEKKRDAGEKLHTTGIIVKDVIDQIALLNDLPETLVRKIPGVRLYSPNLQHVDLAAPGYYFLATNTPEVMRWLAAKAQNLGVKIAYKTPFTEAERIHEGFKIDALGTTRFLIGADGPHSRVAKALGLGQSSQFLFGIEHEYADWELPTPDHLHCFIDQHLAPGYIAWVIAGVGMVQVGLARRIHGQKLKTHELNANQAMSAFLDKIAPIFDFRNSKPSAIRAGLIPCGGLVSNVSAKRVLLVGDAAGMVSPLTAGGIHTALKHGLATGEAVADYLKGNGKDPSEWLSRSYPRFYSKRLLRFLFDHFQSDALFNVLLKTAPMRQAASILYFHRNGTFDA